MNPPPLFTKSQLRVLRSSLTNGTTRKESNDVSRVWSISGDNSFRRRQHLHEEDSEVREAPATVDFAGLNRMGILHYSGLVHNFVEANFLSMPIFCQRLYFVDAYILSTPVFVDAIYFVDSYILFAPIFFSAPTF
jgi:hypothetical protein